VHLKELKLLHLYQQHLIFDPISNTKGMHSALQISSEVREFATFLFKFAHIHCPALKVLVWDEYKAENYATENLALELAQAATEYVPQFIFVKEESISQDGKRRISASLTTRDRLCDDFPHLDLLAYDPGIRGMDLHALRV
jgi:hypothetical protein